MTEQNPNLQNLRAKAMTLPLEPGVYLMKDKLGNIIYIGKAKALKNRVSQYFGSDKNHLEKVVQMVLNVKDFDYIVTDSEFEALVLENSLIKQNKPKYNILLKDDKGYCYIKISKGPWSKITEEKQMIKDGSKYLGPYVSSWTVKSLVDEATKIFKLPTCTKVFPRDFKKGRPCLNFYIKQCSAPCTGKIKASDYDNNINEAVDFIKGGSLETVEKLKVKMEEAAENLDFEKAAVLRDRINAIEKLRQQQKVVESSIAFQDVIATAQKEKTVAVTILKFRNKRLCDKEDFTFEKMGSLEELIGEFLGRYYENHEIPSRISVEFMPEDAKSLEKLWSEKIGKKVEIFTPQKGEQWQLLEMCKKNAAEKLSIGSDRNSKELSSLDELARLLGLEFPPQYIESYDISNLTGGENVAGMVVFENARPLKKAYKKFKIKTVLGQDDYGSMREVINRRFDQYEQLKETGEGFGRLPDLILLDGGKGHVGAVLPIIKERNLNVPVFGMVKDNKHKTRAIAVSGGEIEIKSSRKAFTLLSNIQDEVHRFAIGYHRNLRKKSNMSMSLLEIEGVGETRAKNLMLHFKTVKKIKEASVDELKSVKGITGNIAENITKYFKNI